MIGGDQHRAFALALAVDRLADADDAAADAMEQNRDPAAGFKPEPDRDILQRNEKERDKRNDHRGKDRADRGKRKAGLRHAVCLVGAAKRAARRGADGVDAARARKWLK